MIEHQRIENLVQKILDNADFKKVPIPVEEIVKKFGLKIVPFDFPEGFSGVLKKEKKIIGVNQNHHPVRQRFTLAHELGHFLLGHDDNDFIDDRFDRSSPNEREANLFASYLLMPKEVVKKSVKLHGLVIQKLSREFKVSDQAMTIRLLGLDLIK